MLQKRGYIELFPALPDAWSTGSVKGVKARGNFELNMEWRNAKPTRVEVKSNSGNLCNLKYPGIAKTAIRELNGQTVNFSKINNNEISFSTEKGKTYIIETDVLDSLCETYDDLEIDIYPNPVSGGRNINLNIKKNIASAINLNLFDMQGKLIYKNVFQKNKYTF